MAKQIAIGFRASGACGHDELAENINKYMNKLGAKLISVSYSTVYDVYNYSIVHSALCVFELEEGEVDELR